MSSVTPRSFVLRFSATGVLYVVAWLSCGWLAGQTVPSDAPESAAPVAYETNAVDGAQEVVLASGERFTGRFAGWNGDAAWLFRTGETAVTGEASDSASMQATRRVPAAELVRYGAIPVPDSSSGVLLVDGSQLSGRIVQLDANTCRLANRWFDVSLPLEVVKSVLFHAPAVDGIREEQLQAAKRAAGADDVVLTIDGERHEGTLRLPQDGIAARRSDAAVQLQVASDEMLSIPLRRVRSIILSPILRGEFARRQASELPRNGEGGSLPAPIHVGLVDGSILNVVQAAATIDAGEPAATLACGVQLLGRTDRRSVDWAQAMAMLAPEGLPSTCLVAEDPLRYQHVPFFGDSRPLRRWTAADAAPPVEGLRFPNGIWMHTAARAVYPTRGASRLRGAVVVAADPQWEGGSSLQLRANLGLRFRVLVSGSRGAVREVWNSGILRPGDGPLAFDLDITGAAVVVLAVDPSVSGDFGDRAVWLDVVASSPAGD